ncbi:MAG: hypothetical protein PHV37_09090 [Candidatus Gastranaerophilales bacterium]|nr:hypothetical protein [Candidatus Gastranaerophilales bacterium]
MLNHCKNFKEYDIWFLDDTKQFSERKLYLGRCPVCLKDIARLDEKRISDGKVFQDKATGFKQVERLCQKVKHQIKITQQEITIKKGKPFGLCYCSNKEIHNKRGEVIEIRRRRCDFYGQNEIIKS